MNNDIGPFGRVPFLQRTNSATCFFILGVQFFPLYFAVYLVHYSNTTESKRVVIELCNMDNLIVSRVQR